MEKIIVEMNDRENGATFIFPNGQKIEVYINSNAPNHITVSGNDSISILPVASNAVRIG